MICDKCGKEFEGKKAGAHKRWCGNGATTKDRILKKKNCLECGQEFECRGYVKMTKINKKRESDFCSGKCRVSHTMTKDVRNKISKSRSKYLKENPDKHPWKKHDKFISEPCEILKDKLRNSNIEFEEEYSPLLKKNYSIDVAFPSKKIGIEVNGNQHYESDRKTLLPYYENRNNDFKKEGWAMMEIHYLEVYSDTILEKINKFLKQKM